MTRKFSKIIICLIAILCMFCSSVTVFAENGDVDFDFNIQPIEPTTQATTVPAETEEETEKETEKQTEKNTTEKQTTEKTTKKPTSSQTTKPKETQADNNEGNQNANAFVEDDKPATEPETVEESTEEPLPEGSFYVYLERNNGQRRLKTVLHGPGYLPEAEVPVRKGYVFEGWYADSKFKKPFDFLKDKVSKEMVIYAKWSASEKTVVYDIIIEELVGGKLEVSPQSASLGETVSITVTPDKGKRLVQGSIKINGKATDFLDFIMPKEEVRITAEFEDIPENIGEEDDKLNLPLIIALSVLGIGVIAVVIVIAKRRHDFNADLDPDEDLTITEEDYYDDWIDETIVVEDGFKEGKKVVESTEPDYGAPEADIED